MNLTLAKEAMNPEEMSKLFQDIKEAKAAGKEIVYVSLANFGWWKKSEKTT